MVWLINFIFDVNILIMKTKFDIHNVVFDESVSNPYLYYEEFYKKEGFILDKSTECVIKEYDKYIDLKKGDRIRLKGVLGFLIVCFKFLDVDNNCVEYSLIEE